MKPSLLFLSLLLLIGVSFSLSAQPIHDVHGCHHLKSQIPLKKLTPDQKLAFAKSQGRSDSIDILDYNISLDIIDFSGRRIDGNCAMQFVLLEEGTHTMELDLLALTVDSVQLNGEVVDYNYDGNFVSISLPADLDPETMHEARVFYGGTPTVASSGFGGLAFQGGIAYNLGIGLGENPYNFGRSWFPCFDNFVERSTFTLNITTANGRQAYCSGLFVEEVALEDDKIRRSYRIDKPLTTYLVGVAVSNFSTVESSHDGQYGTYPVRLIANPSDLGAMDDSFEFLGDAIDELEHWYGPYQWDEVGYVLTPVGAMEHVNNIAYPRTTGISGPTFAMNRLMAHELAHQWWGNITTLNSPANMWIKEGNAEYGAHLFTEYVFGKEEFVDEVKANHLRVIREAHIDDDGFQPLSGIPYEQTYGTHTYYKGASMIHNMRAYLGDSLFRMAQTAVLEDFAFSDVDAEQYRDHLTEVSGIDMTDFFDDWIFGTGWSNFEIDHVSSEAISGGYEVTLDVQQRTRAADHLHNNVPLSVSFYASDWSEYTTQFYASGEFTTTTIELAFEPVLTVLNDQQELNLGRVNSTHRITEAGNINANTTDFFTFTINSVTDSVLLKIVHHWTAPDPTPQPDDIELSGTHYWTVKGILSDDLDMKSIIRYYGGVNDLDYDLIADSDDFIRLMYRPTPDSEWEEYPYVTYTPFGSGGLARMDPTLPGDYAFANVYNTVSTTNVLEKAEISLSPNPAQAEARLQVNFPEAEANYELNLYDLQGRLLQQYDYPKASLLDVNLPTANLPNGMYVLELINGNGYRALELVVQH